jgi:phenylpyruvate tautomerase PptA (4-oxalocrotonate tautomerase family)
MPLVRIELLAGKTSTYKMAIMDSIHKSLVDVLKIPNEDRIQKLYELTSENFKISPTMTDNAVFIEITMFKGRTYKSKKNLYQAIVKNLNDWPGITGSDIFIVLHEEPRENWGIRGGKPATEVNFNFAIDV